MPSARLKGENDWAKLASSPRAQRILRWLKRKPQPVRLVGETVDGDELPVAFGKVGPKQRAWTDATRVLLEATKITAYDADGSILRVLEHDPEDPTIAAELELEEARRAPRGSAPVISIDVPRLVDNIASNLRDVAAAAATQQASAYSAGFEAMTNVVQLCLSMLMRVEQRLQDAEEDAREATAAAAAAASGAPQLPDGGREQMAVLALQRILGAGGSPQIDPTQLSAILQAMRPPEPNGVSTHGG